MGYRFRTILLILVASAVLGMDAGAQVTASRLKGVVRDQSKGGIPNATVTVSYPETRVRVEVSTDENGLFVFSSLPPGNFTLTVEAKAYQTEVYNNLVLAINQTMDLDLSLQASAAATAAGGAPKAKGPTQLNTMPDYQISQTVSIRDITYLPLLSLVPIDLGVYQPGIEIQAGNEGLSRVNGTRQGSNNLTLDSANVSDPVTPSFGLSLAAVNMSSVGEFRVITAGAKAEYDTKAGGQLLLTTPAGGGRWTGSAYDYFQNNFMNANDFFSNSVNGSRPKVNQNTFGAAVGGPILRNRTFIFGDYEGTRFRNEILRNRTVLTIPAKSGVFTWFPRTATSSTTVSTYNIPNNDPRKLGIDPQVTQALNLLPNPNNGDVGDGLNNAGYRFNNPIDGSHDQFTVRFDHSISNKHRIYYRFSWSNIDQTDYLHNADATFPGQASGREEGRHWGFAAGSDWAFTAREVNEFRFGWQTASTSFLRPARLSTPMMISSLWTDPLNPDFPSSQKSRVYEVSDNFNLYRGSHAIKFGGSVRFTSQESSTAAGIYPDVTFGTSAGNVPPASVGPGATVLTPQQQQTFELLYNALLGRMEQVTQTYYSDTRSFQAAGTPKTRDFNFRNYAAFVQDDWRVGKNFSLSLGVRYEVNPAPSEKNGLVGVLDQASSITPTAQISNFTLQTGSHWYKTDAKNIGPRLGFAWNPRGDRTLTIRGGGGFFYEQLIGATANFVDANTPGFSQTVNVFPNQFLTDIRLSDGIPLPPQPGAPTTTLPNTRSTTASIFDPALRDGYVEEVNLTIQKELFKNTLVEASYVGMRGKRLFMNLNPNQLKVAGDFLRSFKEIQAFRNNLQPVPPNNTLVRIFGSVNGAISALGAPTFDLGLVGTAANIVDTTYYNRYSAAGLSDFYLRNFPQFDQLIEGSNSGLSYYNSAQVRVRHRMGALLVDAAYTWSKSLDNVSTEGGNFDTPIDNLNVSLNKARSDTDRPHVFSAAATYVMPAPSRTWLRDAPGWMKQMLTGWNLGFLSLWESGLPFTATSGRETANAGINSWANYTGDRNIGSVIRATNGVYYFYAEQIQSFTFPDAGSIGTAGRNTFRGPTFFKIDLALTKDFRIKESQKLGLRIEMYNAFNNVNFGVPTANLSSPNTFGQITSTVGTPRRFQFALRYSF